MLKRVTQEQTRTTVLVMGVLWLYTSYIFRVCTYEESVLSSRPFDKTMNVCMHEYNRIFLCNRLFRWYNTISMRPWCIHFGRKRNAKNKEKLMAKIQQKVANNFICSSTCFFLNKQRKKKAKKKGKKLEKKLLPLYLIYVSHQGRFGQPRCYRNVGACPCTGQCSVALLLCVS